MALSRQAQPLPEAAVDIAVGSRIRVDKAATRCSWADAKTWKINWSTAVVLEVTMVDGKERYRVKYDDDGTTVEEKLRAPFYELVDKDASPRRLDDLNYADTLALAARLVVERPSAAFVSRLARTRNKFPATFRGLDGDDANLRELQVDAHICLLSRRTESCKATLGREPGADRRLVLGWGGVQGGWQRVTAAHC